MDARIINPAFHFTAVEQGTRQAVLVGWLGVRQQLTAPAWQAAKRQMSRPLYLSQLTPAVANLGAKSHKWPQRPQTRQRQRQGKMYHLLMKSSRRRVIKAILGLTSVWCQTDSEQRYPQFKGHFKQALSGLSCRKRKTIRFERTFIDGFADLTMHWNIWFLEELVFMIHDKNERYIQGLLNGFTAVN